MTARRKLLYLVLAIVAALTLALGIFVTWQASKVREIFAANETLKSEGYDLSAFEFELLSAMYFIDHGQYLRGLRRLDAIHDKYVDRQGLVKIPDFASPEERLEFYLNRQNPETGAFYPNGTDPLFAYVGVTANMINFIKVLSAERRQTLRAEISATLPRRYFDARQGDGDARRRFPRRLDRCAFQAALRQRYRIERPDRARTSI